MPNPAETNTAESEFYALRQDIAPDQPQAGPLIGPPASAAPVDTTPQTNKAVAITQSAVDRIMGTDGAFRLPPVEADLQAARMGARPNVELDIESGVPASVQFAAEFNRRPEDQLREYRKIYGTGNVDVSPEGGFVVRNIFNEATGTTKDVLVKPKGIGVDDLITLSTAAPEIIAGALAARTGDAKGAWGAVRAIAQMAGASELTGAIKDTMTRWLEGNPIEPGEIARSRTLSALWDMGGAGLQAGTLKAGSKLITPLANPQEEQALMKQAKAALNEIPGINLQGTPGQLSGSGILLRLEAQAAAKPGSGGAFSKMLNSDDAQIRKLQARYLGLPDEPTAADLATLPTSEKVGSEALATLGAKTQQAESAVENAKLAVARTATQEASGLTGAGARLLDPTAVGQAQRTAITGEFDAFKKSMGERYEAFFANPLLEEKNFTADKVAGEASALVKKLPAKIIESIEDTGLVDASGKSILRTIKGEQVLPQFMPKGVKDRLFEMASWKGQNFRLEELKQIRTSIDDAIAEGIAIPGTDTALLKQMRGIVSRGIDEGLDKLKDKGLKAEWTALNADYQKGISRFEPMPIRRVLVNEEEKGAIGNTALGESALGPDAASKDAYDAFKTFHGANSPEFLAIQQSIRDRVYRDALDPNNGFIRGGALLNSLNNLRPEVAEEVFGASQQELRKIAQSAAIAEGQLSVDAVKGLEQSKSLTYQKLLDLQSAESTKSQMYRNRVLGAVAKGNEGVERIAPGEFVARAVEDPKVSVPELKEWTTMVGQQSPELLDQIRVRTAMNILDRARNQSGPSPIAKQLSAVRLFQNLTRDQEARYRVVLGDNTVDGLLNIANFLAPREQPMVRSFKAAGGFSAGSQMANAFEHGELKEFPAMMKNFVLASLYLLPPIRSYVANQTIVPGSPNLARIINTVIASYPFTKMVRGQIGDQASQMLFEETGRLMDRKWGNAIPATIPQAQAPRAQQNKDQEFDQLRQ